MSTAAERHSEAMTMSSPTRITPRNAGVPPLSSAAARALGDDALVAAMRSGDEAALREFLLRFHALLVHHAEKLRIDPVERPDLVVEVLEDAALRLTAPVAPLPKSLAKYLVKALRNRYFTSRRAGARSDRVVRDGAEYPMSSDDAALTLLVSEGSLRAASGPWGEEVAPRDALTRLSEALITVLTAEELQLMVWTSNFIPYREIGSWLNVGYAAVGKRIERLRTRLRAYAAGYAATLAADEREQLARFFHRAGLGADVRGGIPLKSSLTAPSSATTRGVDEDPAHVP